MINLSTFPRWRGRGGGAGGDDTDGTTPETPILTIDDLSSLDTGENVYLVDGDGRPLSDYAIIIVQLYDLDNVDIKLRLVRSGQTTPDDGTNYAWGRVWDNDAIGDDDSDFFRLSLAHSGEANNAAFIELEGFGLPMMTGAHSGENNPTSGDYYISNQLHLWEGVCDGFSLFTSATPGQGKGKAYGRRKGRRNK